MSDDVIDGAVEESDEARQIHHMIYNLMVRLLGYLKMLGRSSSMNKYKAD